MPRSPSRRASIAFLTFLSLAYHIPAQTPETIVPAEPVSSPAEVITPGGIGWALLVGVGQYPDIESGSISTLRAPTKDVDALYRFLTDPQGGFRPENVRRLKDQAATKGAIGIELKDISNKAAENDLVLIYFSGHGFRPEGATADGAPAYLIPYLTHPRALIDPAGTCIDYSVLARNIRNIRAKKVVTILDACHTGGIKPAGSKGVQRDVYSRFYEAWDEAQGRPLLLSSDASEVSWEEEDGSVFTKFLLRALEGDADENQDAIVTFDEVAAYLEREVPRYTRGKFSSVQTPTRRYEQGPIRGDIPLALNAQRYAAIQQQGVLDARTQSVLLGAFDLDLEALSLQVIRKAHAGELLENHETVLLTQVDRFAAGTITREDYVSRARALTRPSRPSPTPVQPSTEPPQRPPIRPTPTPVRPPVEVPQAPSMARIAYPEMPSGVRVVVDTLPVSIPYELPSGNHTVRIQRDGYHPIDMALNLRSEQVFILHPTWRKVRDPSPAGNTHMPTGGVSRGKALAASLLLPGLGQHRNGRHVRGVVYEAAIALAGAAAVVATLHHRQTLDDYDVLRLQVESQAPLYTELTPKLQELALQQLNAYDDAQSARKLAVAAQIAVAAIWAVNVLDSTLSRPQRGNGVLTLEVRPTRKGPLAALSLRF